MMRKLILSIQVSALALVILPVYNTSAQDSTNFPHLGEVIRLDPALGDLLAEDSPITVLSSGFLWAEGPV